MLSGKVALAHEGIEAFNRGDYEAVVALAHPDIEAHIPEDLPTSGTYRGHEGFADLMRQWGEAWETFEIVPEEYIERGDYVVVPSIGRGRGRQSGLQIEAHYTYLLGVSGGQLTSMRLYLDLDEALAAAGLD